MRHIRKTVVTLILALVFVPLFALAAPAANVNADKLVNLSVKANTAEPGVGDILTISVIADNFPEIVRFGPVKIHYDGALAEYSSIEMGSDISSFVYNITQDENYISVSAVDQYYQDTGSEEGGDSNAQAAYNSTLSTVLFSLSFRIKTDASGQIPFWIENPGEFISSDGSSITTLVDNSISVTISNRISSDANLISVQINNAELNPAFSSDVTEYYTTVERSVTDVSVTATPSNLWAGVVINGNNNLQIGQNLLTIVVTAQDGVTQKEYKFNITRKESYVPENAALTDVKGINYTFLDIPTGYTAPDGFTQRLKTINNFTVPVFAREGVTSMILYLFDGENPAGLYLYNPDLNTVVPYDQNNIMIHKSSVLIKAEIPEDVKIPRDFTEADEQIDGLIFTGYQDSDGRFVCYLMDETGDAGFYEFDKVDHAFRHYVPIDRTLERTYGALMRVFMIVSAVEAFCLIVIVIIVHKVLSYRKNPRPRRV